MTVADSAAPAAADRVGWALTKEVEVQLAFSGMYAGKMLYGKKSLKGEASHIELFDAYGTTPRKYEFPDGLGGVATLPFHEVTHDKKKYVFCAAANDTTNGIAVALLFEIASGALVEKDLTSLMKGAASKDAKHVKTAAASLEVRSWGVCAWFAVRAFFLFSFFPFTPTLTALVLVETWCLEQESGGSRAARNAAKAQKQLAEKAAADAAAAAADASAAAAAEKRQRQQTLAAAERKAAQELREAEKAEKKKHGKRAAGKKGKKRAASASSASEDDDDDDESNNDDEQPKDRRGRKRDPPC